jgi:phospholipase D1/2
MVQQIRNAKNFIYMENQYFLGSAFSWADKSETLAHHIIPMEITVRITEKMRLGEDFKVYILIPMFPEGDPTSIPSQEILHWQFRTIQLMYARIATAIQNNGSDECPTDYLRFFCLGKQEGLQDVPDELEEPGSGTQPKAIRDTLRHCIYVHSKLTIIDDDYVLIGSANINQRSLGGERDTEIAIGGYQPNHTVEEEGDPRGDIHTYRMALWSAHFGGFDISFLNPSTQKCMDRVNEMTQSYWEQYSRGFPKHCDIHMLPYPIKVDAEGNVTNLEAPYDCFPDTTANVLGNPSLTIPQKITT